MKNLIKYINVFVVAIIMLIVSACNIDDIPDPNNLSVAANPSRQDLELYAVGIETLMRTEIGFYYDVVAIIGREMYFFTNSDPRYTGELLGKGESSLDPAGFYGTRPYAGRYNVIKNTNLLIEGLLTTTANLSSAEENAFSGYAKTAQAYSLLLALNLQYQNGIRVDVADTDNLGPFLTYTEALTAIASILNEGFTELGNGGSEFPFALSSGFAGFETPADFAEFNRAIAARVALYQGAPAANIINLLNDSFMDVAGDLDLGPAHFYSTAGKDLANEVFRTPDQSEALVAHPSHVTDILPNDDRINKVTMRTTTALLDGLSSDYDVTLLSGLDAPIPIIRNEELILIMAEANIGTNNGAAIAAIDVIRADHGLLPYAGGLNDAEVMDELVYNRRYSLLGDGHRWVDMRRWDMLDQLPIDRAEDDVWVEMPRPVSEAN